MDWGFVAFVKWSYLAPFLHVMISLTLLFYMLVTIFAALVYLVGFYQPQCLYVGSFDFQQAGAHFIDAFAISW
jgi:hypothetical protein